MSETAAPGTDSPTTPLPRFPHGWSSLPRAALLQARRRWDRPAVKDSTGTELTYGELLLRAMALGRVLSREVSSCPYVGVFLPTCVPAVVVNVALALHGKIAVNLNYVGGKTIVDNSIDQCQITHVITSRLALKKFKIEPKGNMIFLEDLPRKVTKSDKVWAALLARAIPASLLGSFLPGLRNESHDTTATVMFTSGSTGEPKGVILTHGNLLSNVVQIDNQLQLLEDEIILGILPLFHSFGYTVTMWTVLCLGKRAVYHVSPLDARIVGNLCEEHKVTLLAASPTYMGIYVKKCDPKQFATLRLPVLGSEKLRPELAEELRAKLPVEPLEGYGCTETGPVVSVNVPDPKRTPDGRTVPGNKPGTVGTLVAGTMVKTIDPETGADLPRGTEGMVLVKGPQIMKGYLGRPEQTAQVLQDGWYNTGDLGRIDDDGFLSISGRLSRFSKIGGEKVPHEGVESAIYRASGTEVHADLAVTGVNDPRRGTEKLVVLYKELGAPPEEIHRRLNASEMDKLWIPSPGDFLHVEEIPRTPTGKLELHKVRKLAEELARARV